MALQVASLFGVLSLDDSNFRSGLSSAKTGLSSFGSDLQKAGASVTAISAPIASLFGVATKQAMDFDESATNVGAVLGYNRDQIEALKTQINEMGSNSRQGSQATIEAFYDIAGGVADASTHMAILQAAIDTSAAGNANLQGTTQALISTMNSYGFAADKAGFVSDVLTQTVGKGVGTMDEFAAAFPSVTGLANTLGIEFNDLGAMMGFISTKGNTVSQAATMLGANMSAIAKPNELMKDALKELGFESGELAIQQLGLVGALKAVAGTSVAHKEQMGALLGTQEAWRGSTALMEDSWLSFNETYQTGIDGITARSKEIQMGSPAAQFDLLKSQMSGLSITVGNALLPALLQMVAHVRPIISSITDWISKNTGLVANIGKIVGIATVAGPALIGVGSAIKAIGTIVGLVTSPIGMIGLVLGGLYAAFETNFLGIRDLLAPIIENVVEAFQYLFDVIGGGKAGGLKNLFVTFEDGSSVIGTFLESLLGIDQATANGIGAGINSFLSGLVDFVTGTVLPTLGRLASWFINDALPAVVGFVTGTVVPTVQNFIKFLGDLWTVVGPHLQNLANWFINDALPAVVQFVTGTVIPGIQTFVDFLVGIWTTVQPELDKLWTWFTVDALPAVRDFIVNEVIPRVQDFVNILQGIWIVVEPALTSLGNWFTQDALPAISTAVTDFQTNIITPLSSLLSGLWEAVRPGLEGVYNWFRDSFQWIGNNFIKPVVDFIGSIITKAGEALDMLRQLGGGAPGQTSGQIIQSGLPPNMQNGLALAGYRAGGGPVMGGGAYIVGERGPELFTPGSSGYVHSNDSMGGVQISGGIQIYANTTAGGYAAMDGALARARARGY